MKNEHIKPGQLVPAEIRLNIYKEAKRSIEAGDTQQKHDVLASLQMLLNSILYGFRKMAVKTNDRAKMFPEFQEELNFLLFKQQALDELTKAIELLERETEKPKAISCGQQTIIDNFAKRINENMDELPFDAALDAFCQIRERMRERLAEEMNSPEERINYLKSIEL